LKKKTSELSQLKNIGTVIEKRLNDIGVFSKNDLKKLGAVNAYQKIQNKNLDKNIPVCYYLYSLQGALENKHWDDISEEKKTTLRSKIVRNH